jgi:hypothetical protein
LNRCGNCKTRDKMLERFKHLPLTSNYEL